MTEIIRRPKKENREKEKEKPLNESRVLKEWIAQKRKVSIFLANGQIFTGTIRWFDNYHIGFVLENGQEALISKHSIIYYMPI
jgi:RNA chaperone Hfq